MTPFAKPAISISAQLQQWIDDPFWGFDNDS
jgi:hypothetical protein